MVKNAPDFELSENFIPEQYNRQSTLQISVSGNADENHFDFRL